MRQIISLAVNGTAVASAVQANTLLVEFLRDNGLTGTHVGCDTSQCGACSVLVDGKLVKSCTMLVGEIQQRQVTTIEGMAGSDGKLHPLQAAFRDHHALQCGYCTPGMIIAAASLLSVHPNPTETEIRSYLKGNICRCTGYQNIVGAIRSAAARMENSDA